jgi:anaerobic selenocysteine-containing dehydrogenase
VEHRDAAELPDEEYPFILTTGRSMFHFHTATMTGRSEKLVREVSEAYMELNPLDAERLGVEDTVPVKVASRRGEVKLKAHLTDRVPEGVVFIPFHFSEAAANVLTNPALDPVAKIPELKVCAVQVEKL